jgi:hypothetical protein
VFCTGEQHDTCDAHRHPTGIAWRVERLPRVPSVDPELRRACSWRTALRQAQRRGYGNALVLEGAAAEIEAGALAGLAGGRDWDLCMLAGAVGINCRAWARILADLGDDAACAAFVSRWGSVDRYLVARVYEGTFVTTGGVAAQVARDRIGLAAGVEAQERDGAVTIRRRATGRAYDLNHTASLVLALCDGTRTVTDISFELARALTLRTAPIAEVSACVEQLRHAGIVYPL